jgi:tetratricopeptide (TPR) repeat protein
MVTLAQVGGLPALAQGDEANPAFEAGLARMGHHDYDGAVESFTEVIAYNSNNAKAYVMRGKAFFQLKDYPRAIEDFNRSTKISASDSEAYLWRGAAESRLGKDFEAIDDYEKAIRLEPQLLKNYEASKPNKTGDSSQTTQTTAGSGARAHQNEHSVENYEAAMQRVKASP